MRPTLAHLAQIMRPFLHWWGQELLSLVPGPLRQRWPAAAQPVHIHVRGSETILERGHGATLERYADPRPIDELDDASWDQLVDLTGPAPIRLVLHDPDIHCCSFIVPLQARARLAQVANLQIEQLSPLPPEAIRWAIASVDRQGELLAATLVMAKVQRIDALTRLAADRGLPPLSTWAWTGRLTRLQDVGHALRLSRTARFWLTVLLILAAAPLLTGVAATILTWSNQRAIAVMDDAVQQQQQAERRARRLAATRTALSDLGRIQPASTLLDNLAERLPADAYLKDIGSDQRGRVALRISAAEPADVRAALASLRDLSLTETDEAADGGRMLVALGGRHR